MAPSWNLDRTFGLYAKSSIVSSHSTCGQGEGESAQIAALVKKTFERYD
jgi:hypothetical protein